MARRFVTRPTSKKRQTSWTRSALNTDRTNVAAATILIDQSLTSAEQGFTVVRTRGVFAVGTDQNAGSETPFGAMGMGIVTAQALAAGAASIPGPYTNADWDGWFVHQYWQNQIRFSDQTGYISPSLTQYLLDSKAMRKLESEDALIVVVENASATDGAVFTLDFRMLLKWH